MATRKTKKAVRRVKDLPAKAKAKGVRGGAMSDTYVRFGDLKGESLDDSHRDWIEIMKR